MIKFKVEPNTFMFYFLNHMYTLVCLIYILIEELIVYLSQLFKTKVKKNIGGQVALVTGGANGLGKKICIELAKNGCNVAVADVDIVNGQETAELLIKEYKVKAKFFKVDVSKFDEIQKLKTLIEDSLGPVDILVNNAGILQTISTLDATTSEYEQKIIDINYLSQVWTLKTFIQGMRTRKRGHIVSICSMTALAPLPTALSYCASKYAVQGLMQGLKFELLLNGQYDFIKTTTIFPYFIRSNKDLLTFLDNNKMLKHWPAIPSRIVAQEAIAGILENKDEIILPGWYSLFSSTLKKLPNSVFKRIGQHFYDVTNIKY